MKTSNRIFEIFKEIEILMPCSLKRYLRGWVCYRLVLEHGNNTWPAWAHARVI
jgi:hypothetical protein